VVLSVGVIANLDPAALFPGDQLKLDSFNFINQPDQLATPARTSIDGVFVAGTASGPMDIPDSILSAGSASSEAMSYLIQEK
jgi:heterodisulfide reductase subunit A2